MARRDRYAINVQVHDQQGFTIDAVDDRDHAIWRATKMRRDFIRPGVRITVYDLVDGNNVYDVTVADRAGG